MSVFKLPIKQSESLGWLIEDAEHCVVVSVDFDETGDESIAAAKEIVKAVNSHEALVDALGNIECPECLTLVMEEHPCTFCNKAARAAYREATGQAAIERALDRARTQP